ncbi:CDP-glycerol glycerophosphotransferase family protein [Helicobacter sp. 10-6591]|uniref:CDP-glycerol glycerophosphotransferase family protein n=1 Tax=Helicobacter sp. 10-6591 TaxID=2004998 RepID=UPI000DCB1734|nr:CDP-glycerol glycerophosphotransferase family protein [Helicobacter sp. 10-6591]RAX55894.1 hypothetical protein CCY97_02000 [Helicobacter sp. 10-6591]
MGGGGRNLTFRSKRSIKSKGLDSQDTDTGIIFYCEGKQYANVFLPILEYFDSLSYPYIYYTSSHDDPLLLRANTSKLAHFEFIGDPNRAWVKLNSLVANIVVMTTPALDVLQIHRSKGVKHYCHIVHSPASVDTYEVFALDYFDSVLVNSTIHEPFIREVERVRNLKAKEIIVSGCTYLDVLHKKLQDFYAQTPQPTKDSSQPKTILISPSWGREALLSKYGMQLIAPLAKAGFEVIIRPHPQSFISESKLITSLQTLTQTYPNICWDTHTCNIYALHKADLMVGDFSGVIFDFLCLFAKPIITIETDFNTTGYDLEDTSFTEPWVCGVLRLIGKNIKAEQIHRIDHIAHEILHSQASQEIQANIQALKSSLWTFQGHAGETCGKALLKLQQALLGSQLDSQIFSEVLRIQEILKQERNVYV